MFSPTCQGTTRADLLPKGGGAQHDGTARRTGDLPITVSMQGEQDGPWDGSWGQPRVQIPWEAGGDEAGLRLGSGLGTVVGSDTDWGPPGRSKVWLGSLAMGWGLDQQRHGQAGAELWWGWAPVLLQQCWGTDSWAEHERAPGRLSPEAPGGGADEGGWGHKSW